MGQGIRTLYVTFNRRSSPCLSAQNPNSAISAFLQGSRASFNADSALWIESCAGREAVVCRVQEGPPLVQGINQAVAEKLS